MFSYLVNLHSRLLDVRGNMLSALRQEDGQGLVEYGLILLLVALACILALTTLGEDVGKMLEKVGEKL